MKNELHQKKEVSVYVCECCWHGGGKNWIALCQSGRQLENNLLAMEVSD